MVSSLNRFSVPLLPSTQRRKYAKGNPQDITTWFRVTLWGKQADIAAQYLQKGRPVYIEGRLRVEEWTDREGKPRFTLEVHATDMHFIDSREDADENVRGGRVPEKSTDGRAPQASAIPDEEIPF